MISYHTIAARDLRTGDRLAEDAVRALDHWYDEPNTTGQGVTVVDAQPAGDYVNVTLDDGEVIGTLPDIRVTVTRETSTGQITRR